MSDESEARREGPTTASSERLAALGTLAAGVAHEVRTPLAVIVGNVTSATDSVLAARTALESGAVSPASLLGLVTDVHEALAEIRAAAGRIQRVMSDVLVFSQGREAEASSTDVARAIDWARRATEQQWDDRAKVLVELEQAPLLAHVDELRLGQVLVNLLLNSCQAMPVDGDGRIFVRGRRSGSEVVLEVTDNGSGIHPEVLPHVFEPFFTTKSESAGTGLGLSICHGIVQRAGGALEVESEVGTGTTFRIRLPAFERPAVPSVPPTAIASERRRILVVDDDESIRKVMKRMLREHEVETASDGHEALQLLASRPEYDVILCDLVMPGMDGIALYEELERRSPALLPRMIFVTGGMAGPRAAEFRRALGPRFLDKPFAPPVLLALMAQLLAPPEEPTPGSSR